MGHEAGISPEVIPADNQPTMKGSSMMTTAVEGSDPIPRYQTTDDEFFDPRNRDLQIRMSAQVQADALRVAALIIASHGPDSELLKMLGLDE